MEYAVERSEDEALGNLRRNWQLAIGNRQLTISNSLM
jgi:hypothetical protein